MRRVLCTTGLAVLVMSVSAAGCNKQAVREKPLPDPLLTSKKPIEGRPHVSEASPLSREEIPPPPPRPAEVAGQTPEPSVVQLLGVRKAR
jgi:hypothetical protein